MGVAPETARGAVRVSLGAGNSENDIDEFINALRLTVGRLQGMTALAV
jgi:cysteine desulfurase